LKQRTKEKLTVTEDIPDIRTDPWQGLGLDGETLEAKVVSVFKACRARDLFEVTAETFIRQLTHQLALETSNAELEGQFDSDLEAFRKRLDAVSSGSSVSATA
jgi:hypothetical protein